MLVFVDIVVLQRDCSFLSDVLHLQACVSQALLLFCMKADGLIKDTNKTPNKRAINTCVAAWFML